MLNIQGGNTRVIAIKGIDTENCPGVVSDLWKTGDPGPKSKMILVTFQHLASKIHAGDMLHVERQKGGTLTEEYERV